jgi:hypothetical protein
VVAREALDRRDAASERLAIVVVVVGVAREGKMTSTSTMMRARAGGRSV